MCAIAISAMGCKNEDYDYGMDKSGTGTLNLSGLRSGLSVTLETEETTRTVNTDNYIIRIYNTTADTLVAEWLYAEMPEVATLAVGNYRIEAASHNVQPVEWDRPYYYAERTFDIVKSQVTDITSLTCTLHSIKVTVEYATVLLSALTGESNVEVSLGEALSKFNTTETRAAYFAPTEELNSIVVYFHAEIDGEETIFRRSFNDVKAGEHRIIRFSLKNNGSNNVDLGSLNMAFKQELDFDIINVNQSLDITENIIDTLPKDPQEPINPSDPVKITGEDFDITQSIDVPSEGRTIVVNIAAENGIAALTVDIQSETLTSDVLSDVGLSSHLDLVNPGSLKEGLDGLGFPTENKVVGQTALKFDISQFTSLLGIYGSATHKFILSVTDAEGNEKQETLTLISL